VFINFFFVTKFRFQTVHLFDLLPKELLFQDLLFFDTILGSVAFFLYLAKKAKNSKEGFECNILFAIYVLLNLLHLSLKRDFFLWILL